MDGQTWIPSASAAYSSQTIEPGIYSGISVSGNAKLTMASGIYIIEGGGFSVSGHASVTGPGVLIVNGGALYPSTGGTCGSITLGGNGAVSLSPIERAVPMPGSCSSSRANSKQSMRGKSLPMPRESPARSLRPAATPFGER